VTVIYCCEYRLRKLYKWMKIILKLRRWRQKKQTMSKTAVQVKNTPYYPNVCSTYRHYLFLLSLKQYKARDA